MDLSEDDCRSLFSEDGWPDFEYSEDEPVIGNAVDLAIACYPKMCAEVESLLDEAVEHTDAALRWEAIEDALCAFSEYASFFGTVWRSLKDLPFEITVIHSELAITLHKILGPAFDKCSECGVRYKSYYDYDDCDPAREIAENFSFFGDLYDRVLSSGTAVCMDCFV